MTALKALLLADLTPHEVDGTRMPSEIGTE
jgi:hypothetical protein